MNIQYINSTINPDTIAITTFVPSIFIMVFTGTSSDMSIGSISSDVEKNTANMVPRDITLPA